MEKNLRRRIKYELLKELNKKEKTGYNSRELRRLRDFSSEVIFYTDDIDTIIDYLMRKYGQCSGLDAAHQWGNFDFEDSITTSFTNWWPIDSVAPRKFETVSSGC